MMLISSVITLSSVWGMNSFGYVSWINQIDLLITELALTAVTGIGISLLVEYRFLSK